MQACRKDTVERKKNGNRMIAEEGWGKIEMVR